MASRSLRSWLFCSSCFCLRREEAHETVQILGPHLNTAQPRVQRSRVPKPDNSRPGEWDPFVRMLFVVAVSCVMHVGLCTGVYVTCALSRVLCILRVRGWAGGVCCVCVVPRAVHVACALSRVLCVCCEYVVTRVVHVVSLFFQLLRKKNNDDIAKKNENMPEHTANNRKHTTQYRKQPQKIQLQNRAHIPQ